MPTETTRRNLRRVPELPCGAHLVTIAYGTGRDSYLAVVLGFIPSEDEESDQHDKYASWVWNADPGCEGFGSGHYFARFEGPDFAERAWADFAKRAKGFAIKAHQWHEIGMLLV
jgi:hypothetical protein